MNGTGGSANAAAGSASGAAISMVTDKTAVLARMTPPEESNPVATEPLAPCPPASVRPGAGLLQLNDGVPARRGLSPGTAAVSDRELPHLPCRGPGPASSDDE